MNPVSIDISELLEANGFGTFGSSIYAMAWNENVNAQVLIIDTKGVDSPLKELYEQPTFQVLVRGEKNADFNTAYNLIRLIHEFLIAQPTQVVNGTEYLQYEPLSTLVSLGRDDNNRAVFSMNYYSFRNSTRDDLAEILALTKALGYENVDPWVAQINDIVEETLPDAFGT